VLHTAVMVLKYETIRETRLNALYPGTSTAREFLETCHGGHLPQGLDFVHVPDCQLNYKSTFSDPAYYMISAVKGVQSGWMFSLPIWAITDWRKTLYFFASMAVVSALSIQGYVKGAWDPENVYINDVWAAARYLKEDHENTANTIAHEGWHSLQAHDGKISLSSAMNTNRRGITTFFPKSMSKWLKYLTDEAEVGARLFTILSNAYVQHGYYPQNKYELWACLMSQGMKAPDGVLKILNHDRDTTECRDAMRHYPMVQHYIDEYADKYAVDNMNDIEKGIDSDYQRTKIWTKVYTWVYGDIIEVMGDRLGHVRMGHTHNVQLREIFMKCAKDHGRNDQKAEERLGDNKAYKSMQDLAAKMRPEDAASLMAMIVTGRAYREAAPKPVRIREGKTRLYAVFALANHPQLAPEVSANIIWRNTGLTPTQWKDKMIHNPDNKAQTFVKRQVRRVHKKRVGPWGVRRQESPISFNL